MKICFCASSGGHLEEISQLREIRDKYDCFLITEKGVYQELSFCKNVYYVEQINRKEFFFIIKFIKLFFVYRKILKKENPDCIISTGALITFPICLLAKLRHKYVIFIESFARVTDASLTGKYVYRFADLFIVQWEQLLTVYKKAVYGGKIF